MGEELNGKTGRRATPDGRALAIADTAVLIIVQRQQCVRDFLQGLVTGFRQGAGGVNDNAVAKALVLSLGP